MGIRYIILGKVCLLWSDLVVPIFCQYRGIWIMKSEEQLSKAFLKWQLDTEEFLCCNFWRPRHKIILKCSSAQIKDDVFFFFRLVVPWRTSMVLVFCTWSFLFMVWEKTLDGMLRLILFPLNNTLWTHWSFVKYTPWYMLYSFKIHKLMNLIMWWYNLCDQITGLCDNAFHHDHWK